MVEVAGKRIPKWAVVFVAVLLIGVLSGTVSRCTGGAIERERAKNAASQPQEADEPLPAFKVVKVEDASVGTTPRFDYRVVVSGQPTPEQLTRVAEAVFTRAQADQPFSALRIGFYDYPEYADREFTLGQVQYAPGGDFANASTIEPGDYKSMKAKAEIPTKDWSKQLTADEVKVWASWWAEYRVRAEEIGSDPSKVVDEGAVTEKVAASTGKSADAIQAILIKQQVWASN